MTRLRDNQRSACYNWERSLPEWPGEPIYDLQQARWWVHKVWLDYIGHDTPPEVRDGRGRRTACGSRWAIKLPRFARHEMYVLHEVAHSVIRYRDPHKEHCAPHGPEFARLVLDLYHHYKGVSLSEGRRLGVHQRPRRVRFATRARMTELGLTPLPRSRK
jgi:hypothetical protein